MLKIVGISFFFVGGSVYDVYILFHRVIFIKLTKIIHKYFFFPIKFYFQKCWWLQMHVWLLSLDFSPDSRRTSGLATVTAAVKSLPLYSVSNCHVTNCDCCVWEHIGNATLFFWTKTETAVVWTHSKAEKKTHSKHLKHCAGSDALGEMQQGVSVQTTWGIHLTNQCWRILK